jgi:serine palmitoyltransferase
MEDEQCPMPTTIATFLGWLLLVLYGHVRDFFGKIFCPSYFKHLKVSDGYAPLTSDFESLYTRRLYTRIRDVFHRPITGIPGRTVKLLERYSDDYNQTFKFTGRIIETLNLSSYNYLGFAQGSGYCADRVVETLKNCSVGIGSSRAELGTTDLHLELEKLVARFVGKEDAMIFNMGFATNALTIPAFVEKGSLIISDELNHSSLVFGSRLSGASIQRFKHNDSADLERVLRHAISEGQPRTHRPWKKIVLIVEGLYSMEGTIVRLPELLELKAKYKFYLFIDEAHSIGALGPHGKGVCDFYGVDPAEVDILMGTFTKSFGAAGGYIAGSAELIQHFKSHGFGHVYAEPMPPPICQQVISSMKLILGEDGTDEGQSKLKIIFENSVYFMRELRKMGFIVYGDEGSPIVPLLLFQPGKIRAFSHEALARDMAVVVVGYPATPINAARVRFCISAAHTRKDLDDALEKISEIGDVMQLKFKKRNWLSWTWIF